MDNIYSDIAERCGGDIYVGVVGPVRTGKSTFIKKFMESHVLPNIKNEYDRERARDEMPQSAAGKTVMTTEPKFVPDEAVEISINEGATMRVKMVDCVGYIVSEAMGHIEDGHARMVNTPWSSEPMPFREAAEMGTRKVICDHSTIGMLVTSDGSIGEISRESYVEAEERVVSELREQGKPFAIILNSAHPESEEAHSLAYELEEKYKASVALVNCLELDTEDIRHILGMVLNEFPVCELEIKLPDWVGSLERDYWLKKELFELVDRCASSIKRIGDIERSLERMSECDEVSAVKDLKIDLGKGTATASLELPVSLYYKVIGELTDIEISGERELIEVLQSLSSAKREYDKVAAALSEVDERGYGIVMPDVDELKLEEPEIVKQAGGYGVRLRASAESIHMMRANIETEINPIVGTEAQSEELVKYLLKEFEEDPRRIWESNLFGKSLYELVNEGLHTKLQNMPDESRAKLSETLERIINEGSGGLICIIL